MKKLVVFINKADIVDDEMLELVELETIDLLNNFGFDGGNTPMIKGSALKALQGEENDLGENSILKLVQTMDSYFDLPKRDLQAPFSMPIDNVFTVKGRGTVAVGKN